MNIKKPLNILVVEDNPGDYLLLKKYLQLTQLLVSNISHAENMAAVPAVIKDNSLDIALLDLTLPDSTGIDSVISLDRLLPKIPIIVFSGLSAIEIAIESISLGAQDYLIKGEFDEKLLTKSVQYSIERKKTLQRLEESNKRYEYISMATHDIIWEWDLHTNEVIRSHSFSVIFGYSEKQVNNNHDFLKQNIHPDDRERVIYKMNYCIENNIQSWQDEYRFRAADGYYKYVFDRGYTLYNAEGKPFRIIGAMMDITERRRLEQELVAQELSQHKLITETTIQAQEKERNELGKELHDNINQILATVKMYLGMAKDKQDIPLDLVGKSYDYVNEAMEEIRKLSHSLVAPSLGDMGLHEALEDLAYEVNITNGLQVQLLNEMNNHQVLDDKKELMLYRIVQEQLNNIGKHAQAKTVVIQLKTKDENLLLSITDDGVGFDATKKAKGIGLKNISSRVEFYSGNLNIISTPGKGCKLELIIPL